VKKGSLTKEFTQRVSDYLLVEKTKLHKADLGFIFGNRSFSNELVTASAQYYHKGYFPKIIVTGGVTNIQGDLESYYIKKQLIKHGVPENKIIIEDKSTNTQENIEFAQQVLHARGEMPISSIIGFGQLYAARRYMMTLQRRWPEVLPMFVSVNAFNVDKDNWHKNDQLKNYVLKEWNKIDKYKDLDFIKEIDIDNINQRVESLKRNTNQKKP
jgi:uncharacterized SAM-binding protein YcdF (DUF218 family)